MNTYVSDIHSKIHSRTPGSPRYNITSHNTGERKTQPEHLNKEKSENVVILLKGFKRTPDIHDKESYQKHKFLSLSIQG